MGGDWLEGGGEGKVGRWGMCAEMACIYSFTMMGGKAPIDDANGPFRAGMGFFPCWERILIATAALTLQDFGMGMACCAFLQEAARDIA